MAKMAELRSYRHPIVILRIFFFALTFLTTAACSIIQYPGLILNLFSRRLYRNWSAVTQRLAGAELVAVVYLFFPTEFVFSGDHKSLRANPDFSVLIGNHQTYTDWCWMWCVSWTRRAHGTVKIIVKESIKWLPIIGWGLQLFEWPFLARKWETDKPKLQHNLQRAQSDNLPFSVVIFPEGTVVCPNTQARSRAYAAKMGLSDDPKHVILPKSTGLFTVLRSMQPKVTSLYDLTIGYAGLSPDDVPEEYYTLGRVFFKGDGPGRLYIHVRRFDVASLPGFGPGPGSVESGEDEGEAVDARAEAFNVWLRKRWMEKDEMLKEFFADGNFRRAMERDGDAVTDQEVVKLVPTLSEWIQMAGTIGLVFFGYGKLFGWV
ncbi:hypothetical protein HK104_010083 [Borealophlyctis nickersoniae]|nr:hypothetical protein HK104_010083 [Borealophlyctis nickersoniae]